MHHMTKASVRDLRYKFRQVEDLLRQGEEIQITKRKRVIAADGTKRGGGSVDRSRRRLSFARSKRVGEFLLQPPRVFGAFSRRLGSQVGLPVAVLVLMASKVVMELSATTPPEPIVTVTLPPVLKIAVPTSRSPPWS